MGTGRGSGLNFGRTKGSREASSLLPATLKEASIYIGRGLGAKALNYDVKDPRTGKKYCFAEGMTISNVEVFAGKGTRSKLRPQVAKGLTERYGGRARNWQHVKGIGTIEKGDRLATAEVHWFQESSVGKCEFKVKRWL